LASASQENLESLERAALKLGVVIPEFVNPIERHAVVSGHRLHYLDWGNSQRQPIVFLHGRALTAHTWDLVCLSLRQDYHCISIDLRGHGESEWSPVVDYRLETISEEIRGFSEQELSSSPIFVGMSLGGMVAMRVAATLPVSPEALVIVDIAPTPPRSAGSEDGHQASPRRFNAGPTELNTIEDFVDWALSFNPRRDPKSLRSSLLHNLRQKPSGKWTWKYDPRQFEAADDDDASPMKGTLDHWEDARSVRCPTLVVRGAESQYLSREGAQAFANELRHGRWVEVDGAGHSVQGDNPSGLLRELREFFASVGTAV